MRASKYSEFAQTFQKGMLTDNGKQCFFRNSHQGEQKYFNAALMVDTVGVIFSQCIVTKMQG
jgi:hypothetical protein